MKPAELLRAAKSSQERNGPNGVVALVIPGAWPASGKKRLFGRRGGPWGECLAEYEHDVLCAFRAQDVIDAVGDIEC